MSWTQLLTDYGYLAVIIGTILEGETVLILAGFAAHQGYLSFSLVILCASLGGMSGDQTLFLLGKYCGDKILARFPRFQPTAEKVKTLVEKYQISLIIGVRFMYGLRIIGPLTIGMSNVPFLRFLPLNLIGAVIWALIIGSIGYLFGQTFNWLFADMHRFQIPALILLILLIAVGLLLRRRFFHQ